MIKLRCTRLFRFYPFVILICILQTFYIYELVLPLEAYVFVIFFILLFFLCRKLKFNLYGIASNVYLKLISAIILFTFVIEIVYFGLPILGHLKYNEFGFPLLHHFVCSSWLIAFIKFRNRYLNFLKILFIFLVPIIILNRHLFLFSFLAFLFTSQKSYKFFFWSVLLAAIFFGVIGNIRTHSDVLNTLDISFTEYFYSFHPILQWFILYSSCSMYNLFSSISLNKPYFMQDSRINTFPEFSFFYFEYSFLGFLVYFLFIFFFIFLLYFLNRFFLKRFLLDNIFIIYSFISLFLTFFSTTFFNSHTLFQILLLLIFPSLMYKNFNIQLVLRLFILVFFSSFFFVFKL